MMRNKLIGIDLSWKSCNNSGIAIGTIDGKRLSVESVSFESNTHEDIPNICRMHKETLLGIAIDAPLLVPEKGGMRECDRIISREFVNKKIGCYPPPKDSCAKKLAAHLENDLGLGHAAPSRFILEVFPHPAIVTVFDLPERIRYKKGRVDERRSGLHTLRNWIRKLQFSHILPLQFLGDSRPFLEMEIAELKGQSLKNYEDGLDALICLYVGGLWAVDGKNNCMVHGLGLNNLENGYIVVPKPCCVGRIEGSTPRDPT